MTNTTSSSPVYDVNSIESVVYRINQGLDFSKGDPLIAHFALIHSPITLVSLVVSIVVLIKLTERVMRGRESAASFARPLFLVNCGLCFGINGCGILIALAVTDSGSHLLRAIELQDLSLYTIFCRYLVFTYLATLIYDLSSLTLVALQKRTIANLLIVRQVVWITIAYTIIMYQPIGFTVAIPLVHCLLKAMNNMLAVMDTASSELRPQKKWKIRIQIASIFVHFVLVCHLGYFTTHPSTCPPGVATTLLTLMVVQTANVIALASSSTSLKTTGHSERHFTKLILG